MSKTVLEQALEHLLNKEEDKASSLLHDYYVNIGRRVYEDIMTDDVNQLEDEQALEDAVDAVDEVDADLVEDESEDEAGEEAGAEDEAAATDDVADDMGAAPAAEPVDSDAADVADAMVDVESALAKLKAEFEDMLSNDTHEAGESDSAEQEEHSMESIDESADLEKVSAPDNGDKADEKHSPVAGKNPTGVRPAVKFGSAASGEGVASGTSPAKAPKAQDLGGTSKPSLKKV